MFIVKALLKRIRKVSEIVQTNGVGVRTIADRNKYCANFFDGFSTTTNLICIPSKLHIKLIIQFSVRKRKKSKSKTKKPTLEELEAETKGVLKGKVNFI